MSEKEKKKLIPKFRFPEFKDSGEWKKIPISNVLIEHKSISTGREKVYSVSVNKGLVEQIKHLGRSFAAANTKNYKLVLPGDVVYTKSPTGDFPFGIIKQSKLNFSVIVSPLYLVFSPPNYAIGTILNSYFESPERAKIYLEPLIQKGPKNTINITPQRFLSGKISLPPEENEQQKIADCLSSIDEVIELEEKKLEKLQKHKKGLMQNLFPNEGEKVPRFRFPEFKDSGEWEEKRLGEIFQERNERNGNGKFELLSVTISKGVVKTSQLERKNNTTSDFSNYKKVYPNDIVYNSMRMWQGASGVSKWSGIVSPAYTVLKPLSDQNSVFWAYYFKKSTSVENFKRFSQGLTPDTWNLKFPIFSKIKMIVPKLKEEQQKIADCLSSLDEIIELQTKKIELLKQHKKGLMQGLFPSIED
ncbi:type I restriction enzyme S subunit [Thermotomaculum hydrothermale]|uniref:Type I restriction enzyme S subunit n=1 Tax=Thermotomaculum hydrothermale TaxID=981385 RepID=A0A7R6PMC1_9BACT|nr:restriction endonuclease subunit S [Thermotomaculum hydrothermale]BBB32752.1 type I restriction enzyme S subunit [Thermotomaculum hydrothermale]